MVTTSPPRGLLLRRQPQPRSPCCARSAGGLEGFAAPQHHSVEGTSWHACTAKMPLQAHALAVEAQSATCESKPDAMRSVSEMSDGERRECS
jgi:hypothetical protein